MPVFYLCVNRFHDPLPIRAAARDEPLPGLVRPRVSLSETTVRAGPADKGTGIMQLATLRTIDAHEAPSIATGDRPIDLVHLARTTMGDRSLEREVLQLFDRQATLLVGRMRTAAPDSIGMLAHTMKGSARGIGAWRVARAAEALEAACGSSEAGEALEGLSAAADEARAVIADLLKAN
jgi:HPt (histidine-containing phosphotransfer) domain-containing protein